MHQAVKLQELCLQAKALQDAIEIIHLSLSGFSQFDIEAAGQMNF